MGNALPVMRRILKPDYAKTCWLPLYLLSVAGKINDMIGMPEAISSYRQTKLPLQAN